MGIKGDKMTQASILSAEMFVEKTSGSIVVTTKKMFGGHGLFHEGKMFGIIDSKGRYFLKVDDTNRADYEAESCEQHSRMPYFSIPDKVLTDSDLLVKWVEKSISASK